MIVYLHIAAMYRFYVIFILAECAAPCHTQVALEQALTAGVIFVVRGRRRCKLTVYV